MISVKEIQIGESCLINYISFAGKYDDDTFAYAILHFKKFANGYQPCDRVIHDHFAVLHLMNEVYVEHKSARDIFKDIDWRIFTIVCYYHTDIVGVGGYRWENGRDPIWINGLDPYTYFKDVVYMSCDSINNHVKI